MFMSYLLIKCVQSALRIRVSSVLICNENLQLTFYLKFKWHNSEQNELLEIRFVVFNDSFNFIPYSTYSFIKELSPQLGHSLNDKNK